MIEDSPSVCIFYFFFKSYCKLSCEGSDETKMWFHLPTWKACAVENISTAKHGGSSITSVGRFYLSGARKHVRVDKKMELKNFDAEVEGNHVEAQQTPEPKLNDLLNLYVFLFSFMCYNGPFKAQT